MQKHLETKTCLHPQAGVACRPPMVRAHTVRLAADLKAIGRKGHVYQANADRRTLRETGRRIVPKLIGINEASTFFGFCHGHDSSTFGSLEKQRIGLTDEQAFLLAYRPLVMQLYYKQREYEGLSLMREADRGQSLADQLRCQLDVSYIGKGLAAAINDYEHHKCQFDKDLLASDFSCIRYIAFHFDRTPDVMCSGVVQPQYTFAAKPIQNLTEPDRRSGFVSFSIIATHEGGAGIFAWREDSDAEANMLVDSLLGLPPTEIPAALLRFTLSNLRNVFISPEWWDKLPKSTGEALVERINRPVWNLGQSPAALCDDGLRPVSWKVTRIQHKRS